MSLLKEGDRVRGRWSQKLGTVTRVYSSGVYVRFDGDDFEYPTMINPAIALEPLNLEKERRRLLSLREIQELDKGKEGFDDIVDDYFVRCPSCLTLKSRHMGPCACLTLDRGLDKSAASAPAPAQASGAHAYPGHTLACKGPDLFVMCPWCSAMRSRDIKECPFCPLDKTSYAKNIQATTTASELAMNSIYGKHAGESLERLDALPHALSLALKNVFDQRAQHEGWIVTPQDFLKAEMVAKTLFEIEAEGVMAETELSKFLDKVSEDDGDSQKGAVRLEAARAKAWDRDELGAKTKAWTLALQLVKRLKRKPVK